MYIVSYKQSKKPTASWYRHLMAPDLETCKRDIETLLPYPHVEIVAIFDLATWNFGQPVGEPVEKWER